MGIYLSIRSHKLIFHEKYLHFRIIYNKFATNLKVKIYGKYKYQPNFSINSCGRGEHDKQGELACTFICRTTTFPC